MTTISIMANGACEAILEGLKAELGAVLAARIFEAEAADFLWDARVKERYLGQHFDVGFGGGDEETELSRVAVLSFLGGKWYAAMCLVDGEGSAADLLWKQCCDSKDEASAAFVRAA
jgi:hypothetical protein